MTSPAAGVDRLLIVGVDTHADVVHTAAAVAALGRLLDIVSIPTTPAGYDHLVTWASRHRQIQRVGVEGTGSYGGLTRGSKFPPRHGLYPRCASGRGPNS